MRNPPEQRTWARSTSSGPYSEYGGEVEVGEINEVGGGEQNTRAKEVEKVRQVFIGMLDVAQLRCGPAPETDGSEKHHDQFNTKRVWLEKR